MNVLIATVLEFKRHGKDWIAILMAYCIGAYWGYFNVSELNLFYEDYIRSIENVNDLSLSEAQLAIMVLTKSYVSFILLCFLIIASGLLFGVMSVIMIALQGMYTGFWLYSLQDKMLGDQLGVLLPIAITEVIQLLFMLSAGALGLRFGRILTKSFLDLVKKNPLTFREESSQWWDQTLRYSMLAMFILGINSLVKMAIVYWV